MKPTAARKKEALQLAQGLFESKVSVGRPPTNAQKTTYNTTRYRSAAPRIQSKKSHIKQKDRSVSAQQASQPLWRPFTGARSLSKHKIGFQKTGDSDAVVDNENDLKNEVSSPGDEKPRLPKSVEILEPWICEEKLEQWIGVKADPNCFVLLPNGLDEICEYLPPLQNPCEPLLQRPDNKYIAPKILHNYNYLETENFYQCDHTRKQSNINESNTPPRLRTCEIIKQEIDDLEKLLQGQGNPNSSSIVNRYQHEITTLKQMVVDTLCEYNIEEKKLEKEKSDEPVVLQGDLFQFIARHDEIITVIKQKRDACVRELARLEEIFEGMSC